MVTQNETRALKAAPPVIGGLVGLAIGIWAASHPHEAYITPLLAGTGVLAIVFDRGASILGGQIIEWNEARRAIQAEAKVTAAIAQLEQDKIATTNQAHKKSLDNRIHELRNRRIDIMAPQLNPPMSPQVKGNSPTRPKGNPKA